MYGEEKEKYISPHLLNTPKGVVLRTLLSRAVPEQFGTHGEG